MKKFQVKTKWNEKPTKIKPQAYGVQFVLANYYFSWGLLWGVFDTPSDAPPGKMDFPFLGRYLLQTAPWTEVGPSSIQHLDLSGVNLVSSYACCHNLYKFRCQSVLLFLEDTAALNSSITSGSYNLCVSSSTEIPEYHRGGVWGLHPIETECSKVSQSLRLSNSDLCANSSFL